MEVDRYGPWALIVGGSEGIGAAFARKLAAKKYNVVLVARKPEPLAEVASDVRAFGVEVRTASVDLSQSDALDQVRKATDDIDVGLLVYNAGANKIRGDFVDLDPAAYRAVIAITVNGQAEFTHHYGARMKARGKGGIVLAGSSSNFLGSPTLATYTGAKAFSRIFSEALWAECKPMGIDVLHIVINFTDTPAMRRVNVDLAAAQSSDEVAQLSIDNIANGPLLILGGQRGLDMAITRSGLTDRGELIGRAATPRNEDIRRTAA